MLLNQAACVYIDKETILIGTRVPRLARDHTMLVTAIRYFMSIVIVITARVDVTQSEAHLRLYVTGVSTEKYIWSENCI